MEKCLIIILFVFLKYHGNVFIILFRMTFSDILVVLLHIMELREFCYELKVPREQFNDGLENLHFICIYVGLCFIVVVYVSWYNEKTWIDLCLFVCRFLSIMRLLFFSFSFFLQLLKKEIQKSLRISFFNFPTRLVLFDISFLLFW